LASSGQGRLGREDWRRGITIGASTFVAALAVSTLSEAALRVSGIVVAGLVLATIIFVGIVFDIVGVATAAADEAPFHAMAAKKRTGARHAIAVVRHAAQVTSFCNDIVGDVSGTISGSAGAAIVFRIMVFRPHLNDALASALMVSLVAALTVGGKAVAKGLAINRANDIVLFVGRLLSFLEAHFGVHFWTQESSNHKGAKPKPRLR